MTRILLLLPLLSLPLLSACGDKDDGGEFDDILALDGDIDAGASVYSTSCSGCHGADGEGVSGPALAGDLEDESEILEVVFYGEGTMPAVDLTDQEAADLLVYLYDAFDG